MGVVNLPGRLALTVNAVLEIDTPPAGATSLSLALRPVAHTLGELALLLGRDDEAAEHFTRSVTIAELWGTSHWVTEAREALAALESRPARPPRR